MENNIHGFVPVRVTNVDLKSKTGLIDALVAHENGKLVSSTNPVHQAFLNKLFNHVNIARA